MSITMEFPQVQPNKELIMKYQKKLYEQEESFNTLAKILNLAGNPIRLKILYLLNKEGKVCVHELSETLEISISSTSQHLRKLKDSGILKSRKEKQTVYYYINPAYKNKISTIFKLMD